MAVTNNDTAKLKNLYKITYTDRLTQNDIKPKFQDLQKWKDLLCNQRLEYARNIKTCRQLFGQNIY